MLMRCAGRMLATPVVIGAGLAEAGAVAMTVTAGAGLVGAALLVNRMREERQGWRSGAEEGDPEVPLAEAADPPAQI